MRVSGSRAKCGASLFGLALVLAGCGDFSADEGEPTDATGGVAGDGDASTGGTDSGTGGTTGDGDGSGTGGSTEPPLEVSCENVAPCGGDPTGSWFATDSCLSVSGVLDVTSFGIGCTEGTVSGTIDVTGNLRVDPANEDGQLIANDSTQTYTGVDEPLTIYIGPDCLDVSGTVTQCDSIGGPMKGLGFTDPTTCAPAASGDGGCDCTATVQQDSVPGFVTTSTSDLALYTAEGNVFSLQGNVLVDYDYCVQGDTMLVTPKTVGNVGSVTTGTILFERQP